MTDDAPRLRLGFSPDPDDAFMWWPLFGRDGRPPALDTTPFVFEPVLADIESMNQRAVSGDLEITAMSCAQYPRVADRYAITACGASLGDGYGPKLVAKRPMTVDELRGVETRIAAPGAGTSAFGALSLMLGPGSFNCEFIPFDEITDALQRGEVDAGVVIHEGQLTWERDGFHLIADLGVWWREETGLPLPLGVNTIRRDLDDRFGAGTIGRVTAWLEASVRHALEHREEGLAYALEHARGLEADLADEFVAMYVNRWTLDFGPTGGEAVRVFLRRLAEAGLAPATPETAFVRGGTATTGG